MEKCEKCGSNMVPAELYGESYSVDSDNETNYFWLRYINGTTEVKSLFGKIKEKDNYCNTKLNARVCPKCGKVEFYIIPEENN